MTKRFYNKGAELVLTKQIDFVGDTLKAHLVKSAYTPNYATHDFRDDLGANIVATVTLASKTATGGVFDAADIVFSAVAAGNTCNAIVITQEGGTDATSPLLIYIDNADITNFPVTTSGGDVSVAWASTAYKIFSLVP